MSGHTYTISSALLSTV